MLELKNITKSYITGGFSQRALNNVSLCFRKNEFVAVLGHSGSGKTTLLNIIGGLDSRDHGDLTIDGKSTRKFKSTQWDAYRNNSIGFVFQNYNLIAHISVLANIELSLTLSGISRSERRRRALEVLDRVGLKDHAKKKPGQLSGGQMQRVAIARAIVNNPDIILADEPTGALDSHTSIQIMEIIREIAKDKLVIMVTHNRELARRYATRIVELLDGEVLSDSDPYQPESKAFGNYALKKTSMSFFTALRLSFNNIMTKKGRTFLTALASSIGIIGIALIMSFSNGLDIKISEFESDTLSEYPIVISQQTAVLTKESLEEMRERMKNGEENLVKYPSMPYVLPYDKDADNVMHKNALDQRYVDYIYKIDPSLINGISFTNSTAFNLLGDINGKIGLVSSYDINFSALPKNFSSNEGVLEKNYDLLTGTFPKSKDDLLLIVDSQNRVDIKVLSSLGVAYEDSEQIPFDKLLGRGYRLALNDDYYNQMDAYFVINTGFDAIYKNAVPLKICGIARLKQQSEIPTLQDIGIFYTQELVEFLIVKNSESQIVQAQLEASHNVLTGEEFGTSEDGAQDKAQILAYLGAYSTPYAIMIYPKDFDSKDVILKYLDVYNEEKSDEEMIVYTDLAKIISTLSGTIMDAITIVLIAFSSISLVVSVFMIAIITYTSVLERTKEIGVLRALGARKKDITRVFNAETFVIGLGSGVLGISIARVLLFPANRVVEHFSDLPNVGKLNPIHALMLVLISLALTVLGGYIPAWLASKKDPVAALRAE